MIRVDTSEPAFTGGEMSPLVLGRHDTERFLLGGEIIENFVARHQGPLVRRRGTQYIRGVDGDICAASRLFDFEFSRDDSEMLQFGCGTIVVGAVDPPPSPVPAVPFFEQFDGPFAFPAHLLSDDDPDAPLFYRSAFVSGNNKSKFASTPNNPGGQPCSIGGVVNGICELEFAGGYQMFVDDPTKRDPITGDPIDDPLQCAMVLKGRLGPYNFHPDSGDSVTVGAGDFDGLLAAINAHGGSLLIEEATAYRLNEQFIHKYATLNENLGCFAGNWVNLIWCPGFEVDYRYADQVEAGDLP